MLETVLFVVALFVLVGASYSDILKREVPDLLNYGFLFVILGLKGLYSLYAWDYSLFVYGLAGFGTMFVLSCIMFYTGQWGGGDAKLLWGMGALFGFSMDGLMFLVNLVVLGGLYGLIWTFGLFLKNWSKSKKEFGVLISSKRAVYGRIFVYVLALGLFVFGVLVSEVRHFAFVLAAMLVLMFYVWIYTKVVESVAMLKWVSPLKLTEGDWIAEDVIVGGRRITGPKDLGIEKEQIARLVKLHRAGKVKKILIKEGIPFVPSFFFAYVVTLLVGNWIVLLV